MSYEILESRGHGKAVSGTKRTSTFQVIEPCGKTGYYIKAQFRFTVGDDASRARALAKAKDKVEQLRKASGGRK